MENLKDNKKGIFAHCFHLTWKTTFIDEEEGEEQKNNFDFTF